MKAPIKATDNRDMKKFDIKEWQTKHIINEETKSPINEEKWTVIDPRGNSIGFGEKMQANQMVKRKGGNKKGYFAIPAKQAKKAKRAIEKAKGKFNDPKYTEKMSDLYWEGKQAVQWEENINEVRYDVRGLNDLKNNYYEISDELYNIESSIKEVLSTTEGEEWEADKMEKGALAKELKIFGAIKKLFAKSKLGKVL